MTSGRRPVVFSDPGWDTRAAMPPVVLASSVRAVTIYRRGALVTREAELAYEGSLPDEIVLEGLPLPLDDASLRLAVEAGEDADANALPVAADVRITIAVPGQDPSLPPPDDAEFEAAKLEHARIERELHDLREALARVGRLSPGPRGKPEEGQPPQASPTAARLQLLSFRRQRSEQLAERIADATERERLTRIRCETLHERQRMATAARNVRTHEARKAAVVRLEPPERGSTGRGLKVRLQYFVPGARWAPAYTVRLDREMGEAVLELRAMVGQACGEDWNNVALTLSTANPQRWTELPELKAMKIGRAQPEPVKSGWRAPPIGAAELYADYDRDLEPSPVPTRQTRRRAKPEAPPQSEAALVPAYALAGPPPVPQAPMPQAAMKTMVGAPMPVSAPPPPSAAPAAPPMPRAAAKRARGGLGAAFDAIAGAAASAFPGGGAGDTGAFAMQDAAMHDEEEHLDAPEPAVMASRALLDYGRLRLFDGDDRARRGSLRRIDRRTLYQQVSVTFIEIEETFSIIDATLGRANAFEAQAAPIRHRFPSDEAGFDYAYVAEAPVDLVSDGSFHAIALLAARVEATPRYISVPRETQDVFRVVALRNPLAAPLLPGPADVYVAGRFQLTSDLELTPIGGRIELGLGVDQAIKIARNVKYSEDTSGMFKRQIALQHEVEIEITNNASRAATVEVRERLPTVPEGQQEIEVGVGKVSPTWEDFEQQQQPLDHGKQWTVEVPAGGTRKLHATWTITIPSQHELVGGNRREH